MKKILVCGGRHFGELNYNEQIEGKWIKVERDYDQVKAERILMNAVLYMIKPTFIVQGAAKGADSMSVRWADKFNVDHSGDIYKADWDLHGHKAGMIRNKLMLSENKDIELVVAFEGGSGTENMTFISKKSGIEVIEPKIISTTV